MPQTGRGRTRIGTVAGLRTGEFGPVLTRTAWLFPLLYWDVRHAFGYVGPTRCLSVGRLALVTGPTATVTHGTGGDRVLAQHDRRGRTVLLGWASR